MTKSGIVKKLAERLQLKQGKSAEVVDIVLDSIVECLGRGEEVHIHAFGVFKFRTHKSGMKRNPRNEDKAYVHEKKYPRFVPSSVLKAVVNNGN
jgi:nucleoid DNA-binding protein